MQENLNSKKRSYLSLTLLLSCAMSSAYGMNSSFSNYFSGLRSYLSGFRNNQDNSAALENDLENDNDNNAEVDSEEQELLANLNRRHRDRLASQNNNTAEVDLELAKLKRRYAELQQERDYASQKQLVPFVSSSISVNEQNNNTAELDLELAELQRRYTELKEQKNWQVVPFVYPSVPVNEQQHSLDNNNSAAELDYDSQEEEEEQPLINHSRLINGNPMPQYQQNNVDLVVPQEPIDADPVLGIEQPAPRFNALANAMDKLKRHKKLAAGTGVVVVGTGAYLLRKPIARLYQKAKLNAQAAWQKLQNKKVTKGAALKGALGLAGTAATAYAARTAYQNPEAARNLLSSRKVQLGTLGALVTLGGAKLAHNYMTKNNVMHPDMQAANAQSMMIEEFIATFTEEQWGCPGVTRAIEAFAQGNVALGIEIIADSTIVFTDTQAQKFQDIIDTINS